MRVPTLDTPRLRIRELVESDIDAIAPLDATPSWLRWTIAGYAEIEALHQPPYGDRAITLRSSGELVGLCGYVPLLGPFGQIPHLDGADAYVAEVGLFWAIRSEHRRHGYATEAGRALIGYAFTQLRLRRILATTTHDNHASVGVMRRLGMRIEHNSRPDPAWLQVVGVATR